MASYGSIRLRLSKLAPGVDLELLDGWIQDRYTQILDELPWKRLEAESIFQSPASYSAGTVAATQGSNAIVGTGTNWTQQMTGLMIRINNGTEFYSIASWTDATHITLDRGFEQETAGITAAAVGAAGLGYLVGDAFTVTGAGNSNAQGTVTNVGAGGAVTGISITVGGSGFAIQNGVTTTASTGTGIGLTINITAIGASAGMSYRIDQAIFAAPDGCRIIRGVKALHNGGYPLLLRSPAWLDRHAPAREVYGDPIYAVPTWDNQVDPPALQIEIYPVPNSPDALGNTLSFEVDYIYDPAAIDPRSTSASLLPWARPACLIAGVESDIKVHQKDYSGGELKEARFQALLSQMRMTDHRQRGPQQIRIAEQYQGKSAPRYHRGGRWPDNPSDGFTG